MNLKSYFEPVMSLKFFGYVLIGSLVYSIGFNVFILPSNLYNGGFVGISQLLLDFSDYVFGTSVAQGNYTGIVYFLLNIPLLAMAMRSFGREFVMRSIISVICYSVFMSVVPVPAKNYLPDTLTACIAGGVFCGIGSGVALMSKGSGGGEGILGLLLMQKYRELSLGTVFNIINFFVFGTCIYIYDIAAGVYSIFFAVITSVVLDRVYLPSITVALFVISKKEYIEKVIFESVQRGVTKIQGIGAYSGEETQIYMTVVSKAEAMYLRRGLTAYDSNVFIIEENASVVGNFKMRL